MALFCGRWSRMLRGPVRRAVTLLCGRRSRVLSKYFDLEIGSVEVPAQALVASAYYEITASGWNWQSYDKICRAFNSVDFSGGGLRPSGNGPGTLMTAIPNTAPIICLAYIADTEALPGSG